MDDIAKIAAGMHPKDCEVLLADGDGLTGPVSSLLSLCLTDLAITLVDNTVRRTPLGLAVRDYLRSKNDR